MSIFVYVTVRNLSSVAGEGMKCAELIKMDSYSY